MLGGGQKFYTASLMHWVPAHRDLSWPVLLHHSKICTLEVIVIFLVAAVNDCMEQSDKLVFLARHFQNVPALRDRQVCPSPINCDVTVSKHQCIVIEHVNEKAACAWIGEATRPFFLKFLLVLKSERHTDRDVWCIDCDLSMGVFVKDFVLADIVLVKLELTLVRWATSGPATRNSVPIISRGLDYLVQ
jgi:hypothetical protein